MDDEYPPELLPAHHAHIELIETTKKDRSVLRRRLVLGGAIILLTPCAIYVCRIWLPKIWSDLHIVNFIVAGIPTILSILFAFVVDKDLEHHMKKRWRFSIIVVGLLYSTFLWHQQALSDQSNTASQNAAIKEAVKQANEHSDEKFKEEKQQVDDLGQSLQKTNGNLVKQISEEEQNLNLNIGKVGKPDPPPVAALTFSLWVPNASLGQPVTTQYIQPDSNGYFPVDFSFGNSSQTTAKSMDIWVHLCDGCSFAAEPSGFEHPSGGDERVRHRHFGDLNSGISFEKMTLLVKAPRAREFWIAFRYTCENCGGQLSPNQMVRITEGIVGPIFPESSKRP